MKLSTPMRPWALVTGAASGLGLDLAKQLATDYQLVLVDLQIDALTRVAKSLQCHHHFVCDLADPAAIVALAESIAQQHITLSVLINNAGITHRSLASLTQTSVIEKVMRVNYFAPVQLTQMLTPHLSRDANIVNISSMAGWMPVLGRAGYCASKAALHQYFETLRAEWQGNGKHILMVYPSFLDTPIEHNALNGLGSKATHKRTMVGAMGSSKDMASQIISAMNKGQQRLMPDWFTRVSALLYRLTPNVYLYLMRRRLSRELSSPQ
ncbi:SDR family NAD(P)-dependent oxidoreductase [Alteromonas lipotrueae]|uniref:SDR family NAD(P)-dependent oxidoreductase n=1 Tax=Alteromonas lipotrueae TaxID=2803814 RepID=UPI00215C5EBA|nr:SDR family NAD(P)-dependent oxidoreductase [Alteromonas lipotrueae]